MRILVNFANSVTIVILALIISSCNQMNANMKKPKEPPVGELTKGPNFYNSYREYSLEGCQYIVVGFGNQRWGTHKGNCSNPIHNK
jgi:hypothetical protein